RLRIQRLTTCSVATSTAGLPRRSDKPAGDRAEASSVTSPMLSRQTRGELGSMGATRLEAKWLEFATLLQIWLVILGGAANAQEKPSSARSEWSGPSLGFRAGYGKPLGDALSSRGLSSLIDGMIPVWIDVGYQLNSRFYVGGYFQFGIGMTP